MCGAENLFLFKLCFDKGPLCFTSITFLNFFCVYYYPTLKTLEQSFCGVGDKLMCMAIMLFMYLFCIFCEHLFSLHDRE